MRKIILTLVVLISGSNVFAQLPSYLPLSGLVAWYPFTGNGNDSSGNGNNATVSGATLTTDRFGNAGHAYQFNGTTDNITSDTGYFNVGWSNYSISCWINSDSVNTPYSANNDQNFFNTMPFNGIGLDYNWGHSSKYSVWIGADPTINYWGVLANATTNNNVSAHVWNHIVLVKRNDTAFDFYLNGVLDTSFAVTLTTVDTFCKVLIGRMDTVFTNEAFWGTLDDYGIWKQALTQCEVTQLYTNTTTITPVITESGTTLSTTPTYSSYQWALNGATISGATNNSYNTTVHGDYTVYVTTSEGCSGSSSVQNATKAPAITLPAQNIEIYPNPIGPSETKLYIQSPIAVNVQLSNIDGQVLLRKNDVKELDISAFPSGIYLLSVFDGQGNKIKTERISLMWE